MLVRKIILSALLLSLLSCELREPEQSNEDIKTYIDHPLKSDTTCIKDLKRVKEDVKNGKIIFFAIRGLTEPFRQEKYARKLCAQYHLIFDFYPFDDTIIIGQTDGCYSNYMNKVIEQKFGINFKDKLIQKADSMLLASNDTLWNYMCDKHPQLINKPERENLYIKADSTLRSKLRPDGDGDLPYMDVRFIIDTTDKVPDYYLIEQFYNLGPRQNELYKPQMLRAAIEGLSRFKKGIPGEINGKKFATFNTIRVVFK